MSHCGVVFQLSPAGGSWQETILHEFNNVPDGRNPFAGLVMDTTETRFHGFINGKDGGSPGSVILDSVGNVCGTTDIVVFKLSSSTAGP